jgi:O-antigen ligase
VCVRRYFTILNPGTDAYFGGIIKDPDNRFSGGRVQRIKYGIKIFSQDYSTSKKIIGGGFDYLWDFGKEFYSKNNHRFYFDYPHNPILSALLYSGIAGGLSLVYFFFMTFLNFYRSFRSLFYYICLYVIIFSFAFFSGNSIFGCPEFVLISLFPFYFTIIKYKGHREARSAIA